ncbi:MAG: LytTR family transcriptional regulator [Clostridia bacterium]|nr:LytTR family transcriptional regulator [Clostridia bacterium]
MVPLSQILYIEAQKQYVLIHTALDCYRMKCALSDMEQQLDAFFMKCQRSFIVNLGAVIRIKTDCVVLKNGTEIPISRGMADNIGKEIIRLF